MTSIGKNSDPWALNSNERCFVMWLSHTAQGQRNSPHQCPFPAPQVSYSCPASRACAACPCQELPGSPCFQILSRSSSSAQVSPSPEPWEVRAAEWVRGCLRAVSRNLSAFEHSVSRAGSTALLSGRTLGALGQLFTCSFISLIPGHWLDREHEAEIRYGGSSAGVSDFGDAGPAFGLCLMGTQAEQRGGEKGLLPSIASLFCQEHTALGKRGTAWLPR